MRADNLSEKFGQQTKLITLRQSGKLLSLRLSLRPPSITTPLIIAVVGGEQNL
jgi:hypothetical protein